MRSYEPAEFASRLASNVLEEPVGLALHGLVKADENDSHVLLFSTSLSCETWIPIPVSLISSIRHIRNVRCKDHQHPLVRIDLAQPNKEDVSAVLFMRLFAQAKATAVRIAFSGRRGFKTRAADCEILEFDDVPYACCPPGGDGSGPWDCTIAV
jgi:hypothetical protein